MKKVLFLMFVIFLAFSVAVIGTGIAYSISTKTIIASKHIQKLEFVNDEFKILQITDMHEWAGIEGFGISVEEQSDLKPALIDFLNKILDDVQPNLVVVTGDIIFPLSFWADLTKNISVKTLTYLARFFEAREQLWTLTFGNHDTESNIKKEAYFTALMDYKFFIGPPAENANHKNFTQIMEGLGEANLLANFSIPIYNGNDIKYNIFLLDTISHYSPRHTYKPITQEQTHWYTSETNRLKELAGSIVPAIMFTHISLIEMDEAANDENNESYGYNMGISPSFTRAPLYEAIMQNKDVRGLFFGHDHDTSLTLFTNKNGHKLMMGITPSAEAFNYSDTTITGYGRVITLKTDGNFETYIYTNDTTFTNNVFLNQNISYDG